jgi:hypothetical protein
MNLLLLTGYDLSLWDFTMRHKVLFTLESGGLCHAILYGSYGES